MILANDRERVARWVADKIRSMGEPPQRDYEALGVLKDGRLIGGCLYTEYREVSPNEYDIRMHCAGEPGWLTKATLRVFFGYPFLDLRCVRVTGVTAKANKRSRDLNVRLGFRLEGTLKNGFGRNRDAIIYGMTAEDCRWIR